MTQITGFVMKNDFGKPRELINKRGDKAIRFKMFEAGRKDSEPIQVEVTKEASMKWITAGRKVKITGDKTLYPKTDEKTGRKYQNPTIWNATIEFMDYPLDWQVNNVLSLAKEKKLFDEKAFETFKEILLTEAKERFEAGRIPLVVEETEEEEPPVTATDNPL